MTYQDYLRQHIVAADYTKDGKTVRMVPIEAAERACELARYNLADELISSAESARNGILRNIKTNYEKKYGTK